MTTVPLYDPHTQTVTEIPARELAEGCILAQVQGIGEVYVEASKLKPSPVVRHQKLSPELRERIEALHATLGHVYLDSLEEWEQGFKYDAHPEREVAIWERIAETFKHFAQGQSQKVQQAIFKVLITCSTSGEARITLPKWVLSVLGEEVEEVVERFSAIPTTGGVGGQRNE